MRRRQSGAEREPTFADLAKLEGRIRPPVAVVLGSPTDSRLLTKPLVQGVLHGGGIVFETPDDPNAKLIAFWISRPVPAGHDEFSSSANNLFTPADPITGTCNTQ